MQAPLTSREITYRGILRGEKGSPFDEHWYGGLPGDKFFSESAWRQIRPPQEFWYVGKWRELFEDWASVRAQATEFRTGFLNLELADLQEGRDDENSFVPLVGEEAVVREEGFAGKKPIFGFRVMMRAAVPVEADSSALVSCCHLQRTIISHTSSRRRSVSRYGRGRADKRADLFVHYNYCSSLSVPLDFLSTAHWSWWTDSLQWRRLGGGIPGVIVVGGVWSGAPKAGPRDRCFRGI